MSRPVAAVQAPLGSGLAASRAVWSHRALHPWAWWCWALCAGVAVSLTRNPLAIVLVVLAVVVVLELRRSDAPWAVSVGLYFALAGFIIGIRVVFQVLVGSMRTGVVLFTLPSVPLPSWLRGISLGGPVTLDALAFALYDAMRIAALIICVGVANGLANPKRALRSVPAALAEVSTAVVIALSMAPQLIESVLRVRRARRLRGGRSRGWHAVVGVVVPVLEDAIERSIGLAAGMESRGYGSTHAHLRAPRLVSAAMVAALALLALGVFLLLGSPRDVFGWIGVGAVLAGVACVVAAMRLAGRSASVTRYRPDPWGTPEWVVVGAGLVGLGLTIWLAITQRAVMSPSTTPVSWPQLPLGMLLVAGVLVVPLAVTRVGEP